MNSEKATTEFKILPFGDAAVTVEFGDTISEVLNDRVQQLYAALKGQRIRGIRDLVPTYRSLTVQYDPVVLSYGKLSRILKKAASVKADAGRTERFVYEIPVCYGGEYGPDLAFTAEHAGLTEDEVIRRHSERTYRIYMLGFLPGFPYLGGLDESLETPRLKTPRLKIPEGSVGIAGLQTGIYPMESPGGWQLIGRTPVKVYDAAKEQPVFYRAGDFLRFVPITEREYESIAELVRRGEYVCQSEPLRS